MARYVLTDLAKTDIRQTIEYLRERSPQAATNVRKQLHLAIRRLAEFPGIGHLRADITS
jgi:plasmid stabilization system protein ParE